MRSSKLLLQRLSNASALSTAHGHPPPAPIKILPYSLQWRASTSLSIPRSTLAKIRYPPSGANSSYHLSPFNPTTILHRPRNFSISSAPQRESRPTEQGNNGLVDQEGKALVKPPTEQNNKLEEEDELDHEQEERGFERSEKANQASHVNLSARLSSAKDTGSGAGLKETWRLIKIARPEASVLGWAFVFLIVSS